MDLAFLPSSWKGDLQQVYLVWIRGGNSGLLTGITRVLVLSQLSPVVRALSDLLTHET